MDTAIASVFIIIGLPVICVTIITVAKILKGHSPQNSAPTAEQTRLIQEMHQTLGKLEQRIESLETIVIESERKK